MRPRPRSRTLSESSSLSLGSSSSPSSVDDLDREESPASFQNHSKEPINDPEREARPRDYILVIGGLGYIGSHTTLELLKDGHNVIVVDNLCNSYDTALSNIRKLAWNHWSVFGSPPPLLRFHKVDYRSPIMRTVLGRYAILYPTACGSRLSHISGVIHFAAYKSVEESIQRPLDYYLNNVCGLVELLIQLGDHGIYNFVFSSSATVYGAKANTGLPLQEDDLVHQPELEEQSDLGVGAPGLTSPYGRSKYFVEAILADVAKANSAWRMTALRYFNPVGCDPSGILGEDPRQKATNLFPVISQVLMGTRPVLQVFGSDWPTIDGTAIRDFIHVVDLARGHLAALKSATHREPEQAFRAYNLGTGQGSTVAQVITSLEKASERSIPVRLAERRAGDVGTCVAATERAARELGWQTQRSLDQCANDTWRCLLLSGNVS